MESVRAWRKVKLSNVVNFTEPNLKTTNPVPKPKVVKRNPVQSEIPNSRFGSASLATPLRHACGHKCNNGMLVSPMSHERTEQRDFNGFVIQYYCVLSPSY